MLHADWLSRRASLHPARTALLDVANGRAVSYGELDELADRCAAVLAGRYDVGPGDRVALHARNRPETVALLFACGRLGAMLVPLNWRLADPELDVVLRDADARVVLCDEPGHEQLARLRTTLPQLRFEAGPGPSLAALVAAADRHEGAAPAGEATPWLVLYTSGSTGTPKGVLLTHGTMTWNAINTVVGWGLGPSDRTITAAPFFHTGGWNVLTLPLLYCGGTVLLDSAFDATRTLDAVENAGVSVFFGVPTMFAALLEDPGWSERDLSGLRFAISGGAPCPEPLHRRVEQRVEFKQGYGLTEVGPNCFMAADGLGKQKPGVVGVPMPHLAARVVDPEGRPVATGEVGELELAGPTVTVGYWRNPEASAAALRDGWFRTGDLFTVDRDGHWACVGRRKEMFISGGENVYPAEVERVLCGIPGVAAAAVVPAPDERWGEVGHAFVELRPGVAAELPQERVRTLCRAELAGYKVPRRVTLLDALPLGPTGKVDKRQLQAWARA